MDNLDEIMVEQEAAAFEKFENDSSEDQEETMPELPDGIGLQFFFS